MPRRCLVAFALFALLASGAHAQNPLGEEVPYIRTPQAVVDKMLDLAEVGPDDFLIDLGSGDGRIVITAAQKRGARGFGVELDPSLVEASNETARKAGVGERARFFARDLFDTDIREATVLTMYLLPHVNLQLRPRLLAQLKPGTRVVSHDWDMGEWQPDAKAVLEGLVKPVMPIQASTVYLWIVPARVAGSWNLQIEGADGQEAMEKLIPPERRVEEQTNHPSPKTGRHSRKGREDGVVAHGSRSRSGEHGACSTPNAK